MQDPDNFCICAGYEKYIADDSCLWNILSHVRDKFGYLRVEIVTWGLNDASVAVVVRRRKADLPPEKGGPVALGEVRFLEPKIQFTKLSGKDLSAESIF